MNQTPNLAQALPTSIDKMKRKAMPSMTSASQVNMHRTCRRKWFLRYIMGIKFPQTPAQKRGSTIHKHLENYLTKSFLPTKEEDQIYLPYLQAALTAHDRNGELILPDPKFDKDRFLIEHKFIMETAPGLPKWLGYIDVLTINPSIIGDLKTTSNLRYAKTPTELRTNTQMVSYAKFAYTEGHKGPLDMWHLYIEAKAVKGVLTPPKTKLPRTKYVPFTVDQDHIEDCWQDELNEVREMQKTAVCMSHHDVTPTTTACGDFGGCEYQKECGIAGLSLNFGAKQQKAKQEIVTMSSVLDRIKNRNKNGASTQPVAQAAAAAVTPTAPATAPPTAPAGMPAFLRDRLAKSKAEASEATVPVGVTPPDGASRTTPVVAPVASGETTVAAVEVVAVPDASEPAKKTRKARSDKGKTRKTRSDKGTNVPAEVAEVLSAPPQAAPLIALATEGFELYVDCMLVKSTDVDARAVMFEDWSAPILQHINETVAAEKGFHSYLQLDYSSEKAALTMAFSAAVATVPTVMLVNSSTLGAKEALNVLIPHARRVVRGVR